MKIKLAIVISGANWKTKRGIYAIAMSRAQELEKLGTYSITVFALESKYREVFHNIREEFEERIEKDGKRDIHILTKYELTSHFNAVKAVLEKYQQFRHSRIEDWDWQERMGAKYLAGFDGIGAHFNDAALIALGAHKKYGTPFFVTWHGSDIHTIPIHDIESRRKTVKAIEQASCNFFVSNYLRLKSDEITKKGRKEVIYNGISRSFRRFSEEERIRLRDKFSVHNRKVVTFAGNLIPVKNAELIPDIFVKINNLFQGEICFWIIGDGHLRSIIEKKLVSSGINFKMWGAQFPDKMPEFFNCTDVLILPSKKEGLPLVTIEASACGAAVVGSNAGGISESIGCDNCVDEGPDFIDRFAAKVVSSLTNPVYQDIRKDFDWEIIRNKEDSIIREICQSTIHS